MKKTVFWLALSAGIMFALPGLAAAFIQGDGGMAVCFLLFFAVNPVFLVILGAFDGRAIKTRWSLPLTAAAFYLAGTWVFFDRGERAFLLYSSAYLVLGTAAMLVSAFFRKKARG